MREIKLIVVHCTAGSQRNCAADVVAYHLGTLGWSKPGYHYIIEPDGTVVKAHPIESPSNGVGKELNPVAINVSYIGGVDTTKKELPAVDNRTAAQKASLRRLLTELRAQFPAARIVSHRDLPNVHKACPSFDATTEYADI